MIVFPFVALQMVRYVEGIVSLSILIGLLVFGIIVSMRYWRTMVINTPETLIKIDSNLHIPTTFRKHIAFTFAEVSEMCMDGNFKFPAFWLYLREKNTFVQLASAISPAQADALKAILENRTGMRVVEKVFVGGRYGHYVTRPGTNDSSDANSV